MKSKYLFIAAGLIVFAAFFFQASNIVAAGSDGSGRAALGVFQFLGMVVTFHLLRGRAGDASIPDFLGCGMSVLLACLGFPDFAITLFAVFLIVRSRDDQSIKAAGTVTAAVAVQGIWAPLLFSKISFILLQIDAGVVGWIISQFTSDSSWSGAVVSTRGGHNVEITAGCASFHNLSLASLCWVTLTMLHRPYWLKSDLYVGLSVALVQIGFNVWRLVFVCWSPPMYEFWHDGFGKHIFSAVATVCTIVFVQASLIARDQGDRPNGGAVKLSPSLVGGHSSFSDSESLK